MRSPTLTLPKLGVGLAYQAPLAPLLAAAGRELDYVEVVPDILWTDLGRAAEPRYIDDRAGRGALEQASRGRPIVAHGIGLSIGSAGVFDAAHVEQVERWRRRLGFPWHSDHLAFHLAEHGDALMNVGITLPLPRDRESHRPAAAAHPRGAAAGAGAVPAREQRLLLRHPGVRDGRADLSQHALPGERLRPGARPAQRLHQRAQSRLRRERAARRARARARRRDPRRRRHGARRLLSRRPLRHRFPIRSGRCWSGRCRAARTSAASPSSCSAPGSTASATPASRADLRRLRALWTRRRRSRPGAVPLAEPA